MTHDDDAPPSEPMQASVDLDPAAVEAVASQAVGGITQAIGAVMASQQEGLMALAVAQKTLSGVACPRTHKPPVFSLDFSKDDDGQSRSRIIARAHSKIHQRHLLEAARRADITLSVKIDDGAAKKKKKKPRKRSLSR